VKAAKSADFKAAQIKGDAVVCVHRTPVKTEVICGSTEGQDHAAVGLRFRNSQIVGVGSRRLCVFTADTAGNNLEIADAAEITTAAFKIDNCGPCHSSVCFTCRRQIKNRCSMNYCHAERQQQAGK